MIFTYEHTARKRSCHTVEQFGLRLGWAGMHPYTYFGREGISVVVRIGARDYCTNTS